MPLVNEQIKAARTLIRARRYDEARALLNRLEHPDAQRLNHILDGFTEQPRTQGSAPNKTKQRYPGWLPHTLIDPKSPLFRYESRILSRGHIPGDLLWLTRRWITWILIGVGLLWAASLAFMFILDDPESVYTTVWVGWAFAMMLSLLDKFVLDFTAVLAGLDSIKRDMESGHWELIALTNISIKQVLYTKFTVTQISVWRTLTLVVGARLSIVFFAGLQLFVLPLFFPGEDGILNIYPGIADSDFVPELLIFLFLMVVALVIIGGVYVVEPVWRLRTLAAASLAVSSQRLAPGFSLLAALGAVLGIWAAQIALAAGAIFITSFLWFSFFSGIAAGFCVNLYVLGIGIMILNTYKSLTTRWLNRAYRRLVAYSGSV